MQILSLLLHTTMQVMFVVGLDLNYNAQKIPTHRIIVHM